MRKVRFGKRIESLILAVFLVAGVMTGCGKDNTAGTGSASGSAASIDKAGAVSMRLQRRVGTVNLTDENGESLSLMEQMRLNSGNKLATEKESLVMVSLDETKLITMEEKSKAEIKKEGDGLEYDLIEGNLFFNVTEKLEEGQTFEIRSGNIICGIRGTSGLVGQDDEGNPVVYDTDGKISITVKKTNGETVNKSMEPGTKVTINKDLASGGTSSGDAGSSTGGDDVLKIENFKEEDLSPLALNAISKDAALGDRVAQGCGFSMDKLNALADAVSVAGTSLVGEAANTAIAGGVKDSIPLMGKAGQLITKAVKKAGELAGNDLNKQIELINGVKEKVVEAVKENKTDAELETLVSKEIETASANAVPTGNTAPAGGNTSLITRNGGQTTQNNTSTTITNDDDDDDDYYYGGESPIKKEYSISLKYAIYGSGNSTGHFSSFSESELGKFFTKSNLSAANKRAEAGQLVTYSIVPKEALADTSILLASENYSELNPAARDTADYSQYIKSNDRKTLSFTMPEGNVSIIVFIYPKYAAEVSSDGSVTLRNGSTATFNNGILTINTTPDTGYSGTRTQYRLNLPFALRLQDDTIFNVDKVIKLTIASTADNLSIQTLNDSWSETLRFIKDTNVNQVSKIRIENAHYRIIKKVMQDPSTGAEEVVYPLFVKGAEEGIDSLTLYKTMVSGTHEPNVQYTYQTVPVYDVPGDATRYHNYNAVVVRYHDDGQINIHLRVREDYTAKHNVNNSNDLQLTLDESNSRLVFWVKDYTGSEHTYYLYPTGNVTEIP